MITPTYQEILDILEKDKHNKESLSEDELVWLYGFYDSLYHSEYFTKDKGTESKLRQTIKNMRDGYQKQLLKLRKAKK